MIKVRNMNDDAHWECVVVGGGAAGLSAALVLGRARRRTLVLDANEQSNRPASAIGGLLGHDGRPPHQLYELGREELRAIERRALQHLSLRRELAALSEAA